MVQNIQLSRSSIISDIYLNKGLMTVCQNKTSENLVGELLICSSRLAPGSLKKLIRLNCHHNGMKSFLKEFSYSYPSAIDSESIKPLSVLHSGLKREW